jgi:hypothetical protein
MTENRGEATACAHRSIAHFAEELSPGRFTDRWKCLDCGAAFVPAKWLTASEEWRQAYQDGKYKLYSMGGAICEAAAEHLPCNEGPLDRVATNTYRGLNADLRAENRRLREALVLLRDSTAVLNHLDPDHIELIEHAIVPTEPRTSE